MLIKFEKDPNITFSINIEVNSNELLEIITNLKYRPNWVKGADRFEYNESEVTRLGTEHVCVINGKHFNFKTVTKKGDDNELVYGELTNIPNVLDEFYQFYIIKPLSEKSSTLTTEMFLVAKTWQSPRTCSEVQPKKHTFPPYDTTSPFRGFTSFLILKSSLVLPTWLPSHLHISRALPVALNPRIYVIRSDRIRRALLSDSV